MRLFRWFSAIDIPEACDLRCNGWQLADQHASVDEIGRCPVLVPASSLGHDDYLHISGRQARPPLKQVILLQVDSAEERVRLLLRGFGEVLGKDTSLAEIELRALRVAENANVLPRSRDIGLLRLDMLSRDGIVGGRSLGLHPREFALIWRLSETPDTPVARSELVADVWHMSFIPDTNSLAVHIFRLRTKLAIAGLDGLVQTVPSGGYLLAPARAHFMRKPVQVPRRYGHKRNAALLSTG